jgi:hypothetical protein
MKKIRQYAIVRINKKTEQCFEKKKYNKGPPKWMTELPIYLGEIPNMPGHGVLLSRLDNKIYAGYHIDYFEEVPEDET